MATRSTCSSLFARQQASSRLPGAARTISLAFQDDPLIRWLRPGATPWGVDGSEHRWQLRRMQHAKADGVVMQSESVGKMMKVFPEQPNKDSKVPRTEARDEKDDDLTHHEDTGVVILLFPPKSHLQKTLQRILQRCRLWLMDRLRPAPDDGADESVSADGIMPKVAQTCRAELIQSRMAQRIECLMSAHDAAIESVKSQHGLADVWYLEVLAVHPQLQRRGLGRMAMQSLLDHVGDVPMALECTAASNVPFYQKLGFELVREMALTADERCEAETLKCWMMLRLPQG